MSLRNKILYFLFLLYTLHFTLYTFSFAQEQREPNRTQDSRDPFITLVTDDGRLLKFKREAQGPLQLEGIIYDAQGLSYAVVNKEVVRIGDWVGEYQVYKIKENKVIFLKEGKETEVELKKEEPLQ